MARIHSALRRVREDSARLLQTQDIRAACAAAGHAWRERALDPVATVRAMAVQTLHGNTAIADVVRLHHGAFTASAYCQARARVPLEGLLHLFHRQNHLVQQVAGASPGRWRGHRVWLVDCTGFSMPDAGPLRSHFGQPSLQRKGCGFPVARTAVLFDRRTGLLLDFLPAPLDTGEPILSTLLHATLRREDVVVGDSLYGTFVQLALCRQHGLHGVFEAHAQRSICFGTRRKGRIATLGALDQVVEWTRPPACPAWMDPRQFEALPQTIQVREIRRKVKDPEGRRRSITLVTTLLDPRAYPAHEVVELYRDRWRVETCIRTLKHTLSLNVLRCRTVAGVLKELVMIALVYNMVRLVMLEAARRQRTDPGRISFIDALRWWRYATPGEELPTLIVNPSRPGRHEPRVKKRRHTNYPFMLRPRRTYQR